MSKSSSKNIMLTARDGLNSKSCIDMDIEKAIEDFEKSNKNIAIAYGGDGTLLKVARKNNFKKAVFPIRNYGLCEEHEDLLDVVSNGTKDIPIKQTVHPLLKIEAPNGIDEIAAAEITMKNSDITSCMRFDLLVNGKLYMENVICDGVIFATSLGSHGYFKSVTRTIFSGRNIGIGFIAPTYGINNLILNLADKVSVKFTRDTDINITADKRWYADIHVIKNYTINVFQESKMNLSLFGYDLFCCPKCRRNRNSTVINDQYLG